MTYAFDFTGGDADSRRAEADRIIAILEDEMENLRVRRTNGRGRRRVGEAVVVVTRH